MMEKPKKIGAKEKYLKKLDINQAPYKEIFKEVLPFLKFSSLKHDLAPNWKNLTLIEGQRPTDVGMNCKNFMRWMAANINWMPEHVFIHSLMPKSIIPWHKDTDNPNEFSRGVMLPIIIPKLSFIEFEDGSKDTYEMGCCYHTRFGVRHRVINGSEHIRVMCMITPPPFVTFYKNYNRKNELNTMWG